MKFKSRILPGTHGLRSDAKIEVLQDQKIALIMTIWGNQDLAKDLVTEFSASLKREPPPEVEGDFDPDATQIRKVPVKKTVIRQIPTGFRLLTEGLKGINQALLKSENASKWNTVVEAVALQWSGNGIWWSMTGDFQLVLRTNDHAEILAQSSAGSQLSTNMGPLPLLGLGLEEHFPVTQGHALLTHPSQILVAASKGSSVGNQSGLIDMQTSFESLLDGDPALPQWIAVSEPL